MYLTKTQAYKDLKEKGAESWLNEQADNSTIKHHNDADMRNAIKVGTATSMLNHLVEEISDYEQAEANKVELARIQHVLHMEFLQSDNEDSMRTIASLARKFSLNSLADELEDRLKQVA